MGTADSGCGTFRVIGETNSNGKKKRLLQVIRESPPKSKSKITESETAERTDSKGKLKRENPNSGCP